MTTLVGRDNRELIEQSRNVEVSMRFAGVIRGCGRRL
jgi:hypothetical protein